MKQFKLTNHGTTLSCYEWSIDNPKKQLIIIHGIAEHAARYDDFAQHLNKEKINVFSMDLRGHGNSIEDGLGVFRKRNGWQAVVDDISMLYNHVKSLNPKLDIVLFSHSLGSIFARAVLQTTDDKYEKCILTGATVHKPGLREIAPFLASFFPSQKPATFLDNLALGDYNKAFAPNRTKFDWISRDEAQVDKYIEDEKCGFVACASLYKDAAKMLLYTLKDSNIKAMPEETPILILSGEKDPCGNFGHDAKFLADTYTDAGLVTHYKLYEGARHELINEINNKEVYEDIKEFVFS